MNVWIVLVNYNGWDDTTKCLESLARLDTFANIVLVDNASREDHIEALRIRYPWCHMIRNDVNGGWAGGNNTGLKYALEQGADWVLLLNNDTTVSPRLVSSLLAAAAKHPEYGILGPVICFMDEPDKVMTDGCMFNQPEDTGFFLRREVPLTSEITDVEIVNGCAMFISRKVTDAIGLIDEQFFLIHEESDYCLRAKQAGFGLGVVGEKLVWHKGSSSFKRTGSRIQRYYDARNLRLLLKKHERVHHTGRGRFESRKLSWKYVYHRWCVELENNCPDAANAVLEGVCDSLSGSYGPQQPGSRVGVPVLRGMFTVLRRLKGGHRPAPEDREDLLKPESRSSPHA